MNTPASLEEPNPLAWWGMLPAAIAVGIVAGYGAVIFRAMIGIFHNVLFLGQWSFSYDANVHTPASPWGAWVIAVPVLGAAIVAFLVKTFAPEAKGHGVPEVMSAVHSHGGRIRPVVALVKSVASAMSIGSGGSVGREGPIIQIGAAFGSTIGQVIAMPSRQRAILIAAGAGGGIAATFDTPIGGIVFAIELILACVSPMSVLCVALSCVTATAIGRHYFGFLPSFNVPGLESLEGAGDSMAILPCFVVFGLVIGLVAWVTTRGIYWFEDLFDGMPGNYYTRHMLGMAIVGLMFWSLAKFSPGAFGQPGHYYIQGVGYATIMDVLGGGLAAAGFLMLLAVAKLLATCLTLGSGASGGVFSPCMFIGATLGAGIALAVNGMFPELGLNPVHFALAGMAGMVGGTTGAALTAIVMLFEMTRDYTVILPVILTVATATAVRQWLLPPTIYTLKLLRRNEVVPQGLKAWRSELRARHVMSRETTVGDVPSVVVAEEDTLDAVLRAMSASDARVAVVKSPTGETCGVITEHEIARVARDSAQLMS